MVTNSGSLINTENILPINGDIFSYVINYILLIALFNLTFFLRSGNKTSTLCRAGVRKEMVAPLYVSCVEKLANNTISSYVITDINEIYRSYVKWSFSFLAHLQNTCPQGHCKGNALYLYSGGSRFESRQGNLGKRPRLLPSRTFSVHVILPFHALLPDT
jgi:hypothetical protein